MILLADIMYFLTASNPNSEDTKNLLRNIYKKEPKKVEGALSLIFSLDFQNELRKIMGAGSLKDTDFLQKEINAIMKEIAIDNHNHLSKKGLQIFRDRGIPIDQINKYQLGDNLYWENDSSIEEKFKTQLKLRYDESVVDLVFTSQTMSRKVARDKYGSGHTLSLPNFDSDGNFLGIVYRNVAFVKQEKQVRNMYKFYCPYSYDYLFNEKILDLYNEINIVEGVFDALALIRAGYPNTVSPSMVRMSKGHMKKLKGKKLNVLFDRDMGGYAGLKFIEAQFPKEDLNVLALAPTSKDLDETPKNILDAYMKNLSKYDITALD